jgi:hypothetical protein
MGQREKPLSEGMGEEEGQEEEGSERREGRE